jgi:uncharacterized membrane protein HdeD (DUF308 family)
VLSGILSVGFGLLLFARPGAGALAVATIIGFTLSSAASWQRRWRLDSGT